MQRISKLTDVTDQSQRVNVVVDSRDNKSKYLWICTPRSVSSFPRNYCLEPSSGGWRKAASQKVRGGLRQQGSFPVPYRFSCANCKRVSLATVYSNTRTTIKSVGWDKGWRIRCLRRPNSLLRSFVEEKGDLRSAGSPLEVMMNEIVEIQAQDT